MMQSLSPQDCEELLHGTRVLAKDRHGDKVLRRDDGLVIKLFRRKRFLSSTAVFPYARRFQKNCQGLNKRGIATVQVYNVFRCPSLQRDGVSYAYLEGRTLRDTLQQANPQLFQQLAGFLAELHSKGVYFRSLHLGNVLVQPDGTFALIDVADMSLRPWSLGLSKRLRNFTHLFRDQNDLAILLRYDFNVFLQSYLQHSGMGMLRRGIFTIFLLRRHRFLLEQM